MALGFCIRDDLNLFSFVLTGVCIVSDDLSVLGFCTDSWDSALGHTLLILITVFGAAFCENHARKTRTFFTRRLEPRSPHGKCAVGLKSKQVQT